MRHRCNVPIIRCQQASTQHRSRARGAVIEKDAHDAISRWAAEVEFWLQSQKAPGRSTVGTMSPKDSREVQHFVVEPNDDRRRRR